MTFEEMLPLLKGGMYTARQGWNGKGMWLVLIVPTRPYGGYACAPYIAMKTADDFLVPWLASQTDILASDWTIVRSPEDGVKHE